jgi:uncharacterized phiE125 gp8 family phage protein
LAGLFNCDYFSKESCMSIGLERLTAPAAEPVTLSEIKAHARIEYADDDALLNGLISAAREWLESYTGRSLLAQTWRLWLDVWPTTGVVLPKAPVQSISQVMLYAADNSSSVWNAAAYRLEQAAYPPRLILNDGQSWPAYGRLRDGISISFISGYSAAGTVPESLKLALKQLVTFWYEQRGDINGQGEAVPSGIYALVAAFRVVNL